MRGGSWCDVSDTLSPGAPLFVSPLFRGDEGASKHTSLRIREWCPQFPPKMQRGAGVCGGSPSINCNGPSLVSRVPLTLAFWALVVGENGMEWTSARTVQRQKPVFGGLPGKRVGRIYSEAGTNEPRLRG